LIIPSQGIYKGYTDVKDTVVAKARKMRFFARRKKHKITNHVEYSPQKPEMIDDMRRQGFLPPWF
jgi:hypothetical protein